MDDFYKYRQDRFVWSALIVSVLVSIPVFFMMLGSFGIYISYDYVPVDKYFRVIHISGESEPYHNDAYVEGWGYRVLRQSLEFDALNYKETMAHVQPYYTAQAFLRLQHGLRSNDSVRTVETKHMDSTVKLLSAPVILHKGIIGGHIYAWQVRYKINWSLIQPHTDKTISNNYDVTLLIRRVSILNSGSGILINSFVIQNSD